MTYKPWIVAHIYIKGRKYYLYGKMHGNVMPKANFWRKSERGAVAITVALSLLALLAAAAVAINTVRFVYVRQVLQAALDGAMTAASADALTQTTGNSPNTANMIRIATNYFNANYNLPLTLVPRKRFSARYVDDATYDDSMVGTVDADVSVEFLGILSMLGWNDLTVPIHIESVAQRPRAPPLEMAIALDVTQSMMDTLPGGRSKFAELKSAATGLSDYVLRSPDAKVGLVPFSYEVNIGTSYNNEPWLNVGPSSDLNDVNCRWVELPRCDPPYLGRCPRVDNPSVSDDCMLPGRCTGGRRECGWRTIAFIGCLKQRMLTRTEPSADISNPTNPKYDAPAGSCIVPQFMDLTAKSASNNTGATVVRNAINSLTTVNNINRGFTYLPIGLIWAWNMLDPAAPLTTASALPATDRAAPNRSLVLVTDGENNWYPTTGGSTAATPLADALTSQICSNIKAQSRIKIYTVAITIPSASTLTMLQNCASDPGKFYNVQSAAQLATAFDQIGKSLSYNSIVQ